MIVDCSRFEWIMNILLKCSSSYESSVSYVTVFLIDSNFRKITEMILLLISVSRIQTLTNQIKEMNSMNIEPTFNIQCDLRK